MVIIIRAFNLQLHTEFVTFGFADFISRAYVRKANLIDYVSFLPVGFSLITLINYCPQTKNSHFEKGIEEEGQKTVLTMYHLSVPFIVVGVGNQIALIAFLAEILFRLLTLSRSNQKRNTIKVKSYKRIIG